MDLVTREGRIDVEAARRSQDGFPALKVNITQPAKNTFEHFVPNPGVSTSASHAQPEIPEDGYRPELGRSVQTPR